MKLRIIGFMLISLGTIIFCIRIYFVSSETVFMGPSFRPQENQETRIHHLRYFDRPDWEIQTSRTLIENILVPVEDVFMVSYDATSLSFAGDNEVYTVNLRMCGLFQHITSVEIKGHKVFIHPGETPGPNIGTIILGVVGFCFLIWSAIGAKKKISEKQ